ncbi:MAG: alanine--tRNA ligase [Flavobacteriales bacterium]
MKANQVRQAFLDFFASKQHHIVPSAPMVVKGDPTLMFNNSGMAPFKDIFLGNAPIQFPRVADTQKCLRVSGKHNDLEEVGVDTYHHTMFEMLGNWSFGDYFKKEAIAWAWELLTDVYKIDKDRLYVTVFEGSEAENVPFDQEAYDTWKQFIAPERILNGNKKDNFWEMGDVGPCGPCSEIHYDGRSDEERAKTDGAKLVNADHPQVIEIWNNVFMEFERRADKSLVKLPKQHVDTGMGFERLVRVLQKKQSNYDTDVFSGIIAKISALSNKKYVATDANPGDAEEKINIAIRVIADHIRAISFSIADGQLPSNNGAGYVIRRILRRAIRYGYQTLEMKDPFMYQLVPVLVEEMGGAFPELRSQQELVAKVIREEETAFYKTLETGLSRIENLITETRQAGSHVLNGRAVFELYDTFGFPVDLTGLIARENELSIDEKEFNIALGEQKDRSRQATAVSLEDWVFLRGSAEEPGTTEFVGYTQLQAKAEILRYRKVTAKNKTQYQLVFNVTPFYAEGGGQVGDTGILQFEGGEQVAVTGTRRENGVIIHSTDALPRNPEASFLALVDTPKRKLTQCNHSATHLLHAALRTVLGTHVEQKGSLVNADHLRFDFSHFAKVSDEELKQIEQLVNRQVRNNIPADIRVMPIDEAKKLGAMALFGEKYGDEVRVVTFDKDYSIELCGGTHVKATGEIGLFRIVSESAVAAGIRRIEAITADKAEESVNEQSDTLQQLKNILKATGSPLKQAEQLVAREAELQKELDRLKQAETRRAREELLAKAETVNGVRLIAVHTELGNDQIKSIAFGWKTDEQNLVAVFGSGKDGKASLSVFVSEDLLAQGKNAIALVKEIASEIQGSGGGQPFFATAGGKNPAGIQAALHKIKELV